MSGLMPPNVLSYIGEVAVPFIDKTFPPTSSNYQFTVPTIWVDTENEIAYILVAKPQNVAVWVALGDGTGSLATLTPDSGGAVSPIAGNIDVFGGTGISTVGSSDTITFNSIGGGVTWVNVSATTQAMAINTGYVADNGALVTLTLPSTAAFGSVIALVGKGAGGWRIAQNAGQQIICGQNSTTSGAGGSVSSTNRRDTIYLICTSADTEFTRINFSGNLTLV